MLQAYNLPLLGHPSGKGSLLLWASPSLASVPLLTISQVRMQVAQTLGLLRCPTHMGTPFLGQYTRLARQVKEGSRKHLWEGDPG